ncbi:unnamed protein product [Paramecium primaurelia]|uniref:Serine/threonine-protein phosphatase n=1 Tax=Paramecium primaurelia TaxID=5886 RepID=A0A8S1KA89_PARPR|nr:unnamed protein product [Paramecium primaurelia]
MFFQEPNSHLSKMILNKLLFPSQHLKDKVAQYQDVLRYYTLTLNKSHDSRDIYNYSAEQNILIIYKKQQKPMFQYQEGKSSFKFINQAIVAVERDQSKANNKQPIIFQIGQDYNITDIFLNTLLQPKAFIKLQENATFLFQPQDIIMLCDQAEAIIKQQPIVLRCNAPIKIFGDIHGQYSDLMRFFDLWGSPFLNGKDDEIEGFDYLFLGNFVDRGIHSLETICLLLALKVRYPESIHLIRGNHEDKWINYQFGFSEECSQRLDEDPDDDNSVFARINRLFEWLPLAAIIEDKIFCVHGGIGFALNYVADIENLQRPIEVVHEVISSEQQLIIDILWSDPTDSDQEFGIQPNNFRDPNGIGGIVKFGPDRVIQFLVENRLSLIIRSHECVMDGFERFAGGQLLTVSSTINYCGKHKNAGAILIIKKNLEIIPKLLDPKFINDQNWIENEEILQQIYPITQL